MARTFFSWWNETELRLEEITPKALAQAAFEAGELAVSVEVINAARHPGPTCRDCGDRDGVCHDGTKCDPYEAALDRLRKQPPCSGGEIG